MSFTGTVCHCGADGTWLCTSLALPQQEGGAGRSPRRGEDTLTLYTAFCDACCHSLCQSSGEAWGWCHLRTKEQGTLPGRSCQNRKRRSLPPGAWEAGDRRK